LHASQEIKRSHVLIGLYKTGFKSRTRFFETVNYKNLFIVLALISANIVSFFWGGYHTLMPFMFLIGLVFVSSICLWSSRYMETRSLVTLTMVAIAMAFVDEYAHTSSGAFSYFDGMTPSPLTVFGWSLLALSIPSVAQVLHRKVPLADLDGGALRSLLVLVSVFFLIVSVWTQGYLRYFDPLLILVYIFLFLASLYYSYLHQFGWSMWVVVSSLFFSTIMEYVGGLEGLWVYQFNEPMALFIVFTWTLRILSILALSSLLGVEIQEPTRTLS
jgi:hypothetical protein